MMNHLISLLKELNSVMMRIIPMEVSMNLQQLTQTWYADTDGDDYGNALDVQSSCTTLEGYTLEDGDCDDTNANISPKATEICDSVDNNCDGNIDDSTAVNANPST